ncbi:hypothetical protein D3C71_2110530 [compost metagenome]
MKLIDATRHLGTELVEQTVTGGQGFMHALALCDIDTDGQMTDPQAMLVEHRRYQHIGQ